MANVMTEKRDALASFVTTTLQAIDADFNVEDRFRKATFDGGNRNARVAIMGDPVKYAEVLYAGRLPYNRSAKSTQRQRVHTFEVSIWYGYQDDDVYANSSQATFDTITDGDSGILKSIENEGYFKDTDVYAIEGIQDAQTLIVNLSNSGNELAHFLGFTVNIRG